MYVSTSPFNPVTNEISQPRHQRVDAAAAVSFKNAGAGRGTKLDKLYQQGSAKIRFPKHYSDQLEAVLINTAGGLTGGDVLSWDVQLDENCNAVITTQACEKAYKSSSGTASVQTSLRLKSGSILHWVPQDTILYEGSSLCRTLEVDMEEGAELLALESIMLGRDAMGETITDFAFHDRWRIRRDGQFIFADDLRLSGLQTSKAKMGANKAIASFVYVSGKNEETLQRIAGDLRVACGDAIAGFSAFEGKITGRILAPDTYELRQSLAPVLRVLRGTDLPRVWRI